MKTQTRLALFSVFLGMLLLLTNSCSKNETPAPKTVSDELFYEQLGSTLIKCYTDIYNQNLAGKPTGSQNITNNGPMGGTVTITGTDAYDGTHGITTTSLSFSMTNVGYTFSKASASGKMCTTQVTITGATTYNGSFSTTYTSLNHASQNLHVSGSVSFDGAVRNIDMTGLVNINRSSTTSVNLFGNNVSW